MPCHPDPPPPCLQRLGRRRLQVLAYRDELAAPVEFDTVSRDDAEVGHFVDDSRLDVSALRDYVAVLEEQVDLFRSHGEPVPVSVDQVRDPYETGDELGCWALVDVDRCADLLDLAGAHHREPVAHGERLLLVMGDVDKGDPDLALDPLKFGLHLLAQFQVESAERLVEEQDLGLVHYRPGERYALALAARELQGFAAPEAGQPHHVEHPLGSLAPFTLGTLRILSPYSTFSITVM